MNYQVIKEYTFLLNDITNIKAKLEFKRFRQYGKVNAIFCN